MADHFKLNKMGLPMSLGRAPKLEVCHLERIETDNEIRATVGYIKSDNYIAVAYGVEVDRVRRLREEVESHKGREAPAYAKSFAKDSDGHKSDELWRKSATISSEALRNALIAAYVRRADNDNSSLNEAAFALGMRP